MRITGTNPGLPNFAVQVCTPISLLDLVLQL